MIPNVELDGGNLLVIIIRTKLAWAYLLECRDSSRCRKEGGLVSSRIARVCTRERNERTRINQHHHSPHPRRGVRQHGQNVIKVLSLSADAQGVVDGHWSLVLASAPTASAPVSAHGFSAVGANDFHLGARSSDGERSVEQCPAVDGS